MTLQELKTEYAQECANTRRLLATVPMDKASWKPHDKSFTLGVLAHHIAEIPSWAKMTIETDVLDFAEDAGERNYVQTTEELLALHDKCVAEALTCFDSNNDSRLSENWTMRNGEVVYFTMPKSEVVRTWVFNHLYHHRGQLTVYLRFLGIPLVGMYGPTADDVAM